MIGTPSIFKLIRKVVVLERVLSTLFSGWLYRVVEVLFFNMNQENEIYRQDLYMSVGTMKD